MPNLEIDDIQGLLISGNDHLPHSRYLFIHFADRSKAKSWLNWIVPMITTATRPIDAVTLKAVKPEFTVNLAFTHQGLAALGYPHEELHEFSPEFIRGMADPVTARQLGDTGASRPTRWAIGGPKAERAIHALVILQAATDAEANNMAALHGQQMTLAAPVQAGWSTPKGNREHFGFADGVSQPEIEGSPKLRRDPDEVPAGEFILGYPNADGMLPSTSTLEPRRDPRNILPPAIHASPEARRDFGRNGSYLVFRKLAQDVAAFRNYIDATATPPLRDRLAAKLVGRWRSGQPLSVFPDKDPGVPAGGKADNNFGYRAHDAEGLRCPIGAHIRRSNPRDGLEQDSELSLRVVRRHRIVRRGANYGLPLEADAPDDGQERGLFFICLNADIRQQFEFIQQTWLNNTKFAGLSDERDPLVGDNFEVRFPTRRPHNMTIQARPVRQRLRGLPRFVHVRGGGYFFMPGMRALRYLL